MRQVSDGFLLNMAEVSAALVGLFLVGLFFYLQTGFRRFERAQEIIEQYFRAGARIVLILFAFPLILSLTLVVLDLTWSRILFAVLSVILVAANIDTAVRIPGVARETGSTALWVNEVVGTAAVVVIVLLPWILGGIDPTREDLTWSVLLAFAAGFVSICATVLSAFDLSRFEAPG
jgi:hypothetical protein